jgi:hypothetical protein
MHELLRYTYLLSFIGLQPELDFKSNTIAAFKSNAHLTFCNRAALIAPPTLADINAMHHFFGPLPFTVWVPEAEKFNAAFLHLAQLAHRITYPLMVAPLKAVKYTPQGHIEVRHIQSAADILAQWLPVLVESYGMKAPEEFKKYIEALLETPRANHIRFYIAYYDGVAAAVSLTINHGDIIALHWVGTLHNYRNKGLGSAVSAYAITHNVGEAHTAILFASELGKSVYEKIGFKTATACEVYIKAETEPFIKVC